MCLFLPVCDCVFCNMFVACFFFLLAVEYALWGAVACLLWVIVCVFPPGGYCLFVVNYCCFVRVPVLGWFLSICVFCLLLLFFVAAFVDCCL